MPKLQPIPVTKRGERRRYRLLEEWECDLLGREFIFIIPRGFIFDGASIPRLFWNMLSPSGYLFIAGLLHDWLYKYRFAYIYSKVDSKDGKSLDGRKPGIYKKCHTQQESDQKFEELADKICVGAHFFTKCAYVALRGFGHIAWNNHRKRDVRCVLQPVGFKPWAIEEKEAA